MVLRLSHHKVHVYCDNGLIIHLIEYIIHLLHVVNDIQSTTGDMCSSSAESNFVSNTSLKEYLNICHRYVTVDGEY